MREIKAIAGKDVTEILQTRHSRIVAVIGIATAIILVLMWLISTQVCIKYYSGYRFEFNLANGRASITIHRGLSALTSKELIPNVGWSYIKAQGILASFKYTFGFWPSLDFTKGFVEVEGPLYLPLGLLLLVMFVLLRRHREFPIGMCRNCGYDLQGIETEKCPECGTRIVDGRIGDMAG